MYAGSCVRFIAQSRSYVILMYIVLLIGLAYNCVIVLSLVGLVCLCSVVPLLLNLVDEVTSALHERPFQEVAERYSTCLCCVQFVCCYNMLHI